MWPLYFREHAESEMKSPYEGIALLCAAVLLVSYAIIFNPNLFGILVCVSILMLLFSLVIFKNYVFLRMYVMIDLYMDRSGIQVLDYKNRMIKSVEYREINGFERRYLDIDGNTRNNHLYMCSRHEIILIYFNEAKCFEDLKLESRKANNAKLYNDHWAVNRNAPNSNIYGASSDNTYLGIDVFFHEACIAVAYNDCIWDQLCAFGYCQELCANTTASLMKLVRRRPNRPQACSA